MSAAAGAGAGAGAGSINTSGSESFNKVNLIKSHPLNIHISEEDDKALKDAEGIFSFTLYLWHKLDYFFDPTQKDKYIIGHLLFLYGIFSYIEMCNTIDAWKRWKVCVFFDDNTIYMNEKTMNFLRSKGVIICSVSISEKFYAYQQGLYRVARYYPMFFYDKPVFVRDADTLFPTVIEKTLSILIGTPNTIYQQFDVSKWPYNNLNEISDEHPAFEPSPRFIHDIARWESIYKGLCEKYGKNLYVAYDDDYSLYYDGLNINKLEKNLIKSTNYNYNYLKSKDNDHARFLAGCVASLHKLDENIWYNLSSFLKNLPPINKVMIDEYYLSLVVYPHERKTNNVGFFYLEYTFLDDRDDFESEVYLDIAREYELPSDFFKKYKISTIRTRKEGHYTKQIRFLMKPEMQLGDNPLIIYIPKSYANFSNAPYMLESYKVGRRNSRKNFRKSRKFSKINRKTRRINKK